MDASFLGRYEVMGGASFLIQSAAATGRREAAGLQLLAGESDRKKYTPRIFHCFILSISTSWYQSKFNVPYELLITTG